MSGDSILEANHPHAIDQLTDLGHLRAVLDAELPQCVDRKTTELKRFDSNHDSHNLTPTLAIQRPLESVRALV